MDLSDGKAQLPARSGISYKLTETHLCFTFLCPPNVRFQLFCPAGSISQPSNNSHSTMYLSLSATYDLHYSVILQGFTEPLNSRDDSLKWGRCLLMVFSALCLPLTFSQTGRKEVCHSNTNFRPKTHSFLHGPCWHQHQYLKQETGEMRNKSQNKCRELFELPEHFPPALFFCSHP